MREVRVATVIIQAGGLTHRQILSRALALAERAGEDAADILCLPENLGSAGCDRKSGTRVRGEPVPGPTTGALARVARRYRMYVICPLLERTPTGCYNTAVLIDRHGSVAGRYRKFVPTIGELEKGISPGTEIQALRTDFGSIGIAICFDLNFRDVEDAWRRQQPDIIFWPSAFEGGPLLRQWARHCNAYVVAANWGEVAAICDKTGRVLAQATWQCPVVTVALNLERRVYHYDTNHAKIAAIKKKYGPAVSAEYLVPWGRIALTAHRPGLTIRQLEQKFRLEDMDKYLERSRARRDALARAGGPGR